MKLTIEEDESQKWVLDTTEITDNEFREDIEKYGMKILNICNEKFKEEKDNLIITVRNK